MALPPLITARLMWEFLSIIHPYIVTSKDTHEPQVLGLLGPPLFEKLPCCPRWALSELTTLACVPELVMVQLFMWKIRLEALQGFCYVGMYMGQEGFLGRFAHYRVIRGSCQSSGPLDGQPGGRVIWGPKNITMYVHAVHVYLHVYMSTL